MLQEDRFTVMRLLQGCRVYLDLPVSLLDRHRELDDKTKHKRTFLFIG